MDITTQFLIAVPIVLGVVQAIKVAGLPTKWAPLTSIVLGIVAASVIGGWSFSGTIVVQGVIAGLSAAGLWSGVKTTITA